MKKNKKLQKYVNDSMKEYYNESFLEQLKKNLLLENLPDKQRGGRFYFMIAGAACVVLILILASIFLFTPFKSDNNDLYSNESTKFYSYANRIEIKASFTELNSILNEIYFSENNIIGVSKIEDTVYNETLYYVIRYEFNDGLDIIKIIVDVNKDFEYDFGNKLYNRLSEVNGCDIAYLEVCEEEDDGIYCFTGRAEITSISEQVYIEYEGISTERASNFLICIEKIILRKQNLQFN